MINGYLWLFMVFHGYPGNLNVSDSHGLCKLRDLSTARAASCKPPTLKAMGVLDFRICTSCSRYLKIVDINGYQWISMDINGYHDLEDVDVVCLPDVLGDAQLGEISHVSPVVCPAVGSTWQG